MQINTSPSPWPTQFCGNPYAAEVKQQLLPVNVSDIIDQVKDRKIHESFEVLVMQVLKTIMEQEKAATLT
jgi:hypothetical protein